MYLTRVLACACLCIPGITLAKPPASPEFLNSGKILPANLPFSEAVRADGWLLLAGQIGIEPGSLKLAPGGLKAETRQAMNNLKTVLETHGYASAGKENVRILVAPTDFRDGRAAPELRGPPWVADLYRQIRLELRDFPR